MMLQERRSLGIRRAAAAALAATVLAAAGCAHAQGQGAPALAVTVESARRGSVANYALLDGQVEPLQESTLSSEIPGRVLALYVNEGTRVRGGELLAKIDDATLRAQLAQAQAQLAQARAQYAGSSLQNPMQQQQSSAAVVNAEQAVLQARNALVAAQANADVAQSTFESDEQLFAQGYLARTQLDQARSTAVSAEQQLNSARASLRQAQENLFSARKATLQISVQQANTLAQKANVAAAAAQVELIRAQIAQTNIVAPFDGYVTARNVDPGALATPGTALLTISQLDQVWIDVPIPDGDLAYVHAGTPVDFVPAEDAGKRYSSRISEVNRVPSKGTLSYRARIRYENPHTVLRGGELVRVRLLAAAVNGAMVVPRAALLHTERGDEVFVVRREKAHVVPVRVGVENDELAAVSSPQIVPGTQVIVSRPDALQEGSAVAVASPNGG